MKSIVTVSNYYNSRQHNSQVVIVTSLYDQEGDDLGLASISCDEYGTFSFKVQLRYVPHTVPKWEEIYDTLNFGRAKAKDVYAKLLTPLIGYFDDEQYHIINNIPDDDFPGDTNSGWNAVLKSVDDFLSSIDPEFRILPVIKVDPTGDLPHKGSCHAGE